MRVPTLGRGGIAAPSFSTSDGVGYVAGLLRRAVLDITGRPPWVGDLAHAGHDRVPMLRRATFAGALLAAEATRRADWILFSHVGVARAQRLVPRALAVPYGVFVHGIEMNPEGMSDDRLDVLAAATLRLANSSFTARRVEALYPRIGRVDACPLALLPKVGRLRDAAPDDRDEGLLADLAAGDLVLVVGRMSASERYKGHDQLLDAWPEVRGRVPSARLVVVGGGDDVDRLRRKATDTHVGDAVHFCGRVSAATLDALLDRASVFAMPSRGEGFGLVYLEAMRAGLPCIASPNDGGAEVVVHGETGLLVPQEDVPALARAVVALLTDRRRARSLGEAGRRRYEAHFTFERFRDRLAALLSTTFSEAAGAAR